MISIIPEHAPPAPDDCTDTLKLIVADDILTEFPREEAPFILNGYAEEIVIDIKKLEAMKLMPGGKVDQDSLKIALSFMVVTDHTETHVNEKYTQMFHKLVLQKFMWNIG